MNESILIRCEGSESYGHPGGDAQMCRMCGAWFGYDLDNPIPEHLREDILAEIARGDFDQ